MNRTWLHRAIGAAMLAGGMLFAGATSASAGIPVAGAGAPAPHHIVAPSGGLAQPISMPRDLATGAVGDGTVHTLPYRLDRRPVFTETDATSGIPTNGNTPTSGMSVDGGKVLSATGSLVQPVQQLGGPAAGPLSGLTGGSEGTVAPIPVSAPAQVLPVGVTEDGFTVGQNNQLPSTDLLNQVGGATGGTVGKLVGTAAPTGPSDAAGTPIQGPTGESAREDTLSDAASGANVAGFPLSTVTDPVTTQLSGEADQPTTQTQPTTDPTTTQPTDPSTGTTGGSSPLGGDPLGGVTSLLGGVA